MLALTAAQSHVRDAVSALRELDATVGPLLRAYKSFLRAAYGTSAQQLAAFALPYQKGGSSVPS